MTATHLDRPGETPVVFSTSTGELEGIPCALAFGPDDALYVADEGQRAILRVSPEGEIECFITHWQGQQINGANDLVFDPRGKPLLHRPMDQLAEQPDRRRLRLRMEARALCTRSTPACSSPTAS